VTAVIRHKNKCEKLKQNKSSSKYVPQEQLAAAQAGGGDDDFAGPFAGKAGGQGGAAGVDPEQVSALKEQLDAAQAHASEQSRSWELAKEQASQANKQRTKMLMKLGVQRVK
jgi:hypothetical protein